jgi:hypothetical protein
MAADFLTHERLCNRANLHLAAKELTMEVKAIPLHGFENRDTMNTGTGVENVAFASQLNWTAGENGNFAVPFRGGKPIGEEGFLFPVGTSPEYMAIWYRKEIAGEGDEELPEEPAPLTPEEIRASLPDLSRKQFRLGMRDLGVTSAMINAAIAAIENEDQREIAQIEWEDSLSYSRMHPLIAQLAGAFGKTAEEIDAVWATAINYT